MQKGVSAIFNSKKARESGSQTYEIHNQVNAGPYNNQPSSLPQQRLADACLPPIPNMYHVKYGTVAPTKERFEEHKAQYRRQRDTFRADPRSSVELSAWKRVDNGFNYQLLNQSGKAFVPPALVGKQYQASDTFFSEYALHNPSSLILSSSTHSYIIGNMASYDGRQYPLAPTEKRPEGQGFCHTLVIPRERVYNVVDPDATANDCFLLKEMRAHFIRFMSTDGGKAALLARAKKALTDQDRKLTFAKDNDAYTSEIRQAVYADFDVGSRIFMKLKQDDFIFGFHVFPENSIGHLHMHVFPSWEALREWSTRDYDYKTVPFEAIMEVERGQ
ncbi:MAG: hypothetical protein Q9186_000456 [Xanthomendoza sp. 1 TL-2023]